MARYPKRKYNLHVAMVMAVYFVLLFFVWPLAGTVSSPALQAILAVSPAVPIVIVIALAARFMVRSDELEQRTHLIALSIATGVVSAASVVGGFLALAKVWQVGGAILFWVFPALCVVYGVARIITVRRFTGSWHFWAC